MGLAIRREDRSTSDRAKTARIVTGLRGADLLLSYGLVQEQAVIERVVDEFHEDVLFLSYGILRGESELHKAFLAAFYAWKIPGSGAIRVSNSTTGKSIHHQRRPLDPGEKSLVSNSVESVRIPRYLERWPWAD